MYLREELDQRGWMEMWGQSWGDNEMIGFKGMIENEGIKGCEGMIRHEGRIRHEGKIRHKGKIRHEGMKLKNFVCLPKFLDSKSHSDLRSQLHEWYD